MDMKEAYDLKALGDKLKAQGLELAEDGAENVYVSVKEWLKESAEKSTNAIDNVVTSFLDQLDPVVLPLIDEINPGDNVEA